MSEGAELEAAPDPRIGLMIEGRYKIVRRIGEGGMGAVYEGEHVAIKRRVAIKCLHTQLASNAEIVARFHREAMAVNAIRHENIVEVTDLGRFADGTVYMVLEFLEGIELAELVDQEGALTVARTVKIVSQICDALGAAHDKGIVHRDLKPENIYLVPRSGDPDFVKVLDFGIAKFLESGPHSAKTQTGMSVGTPYYMAPEQAEGRKTVDGRADIYALGVILFHLLTGRFPFEADTIPMLFVKICTTPAPSVRLFRPELPEPLEQLIDRMLSKNPDERPQTTAEVKNGLTPFASDDSAPKIAEVGMLATMAAGDVVQSGTRPSQQQVPADVPTPNTKQLGTPDDWKSDEAKAAAAPAVTQASTQPPHAGARSFQMIGVVVALVGLGGLAVAMATGAFRGGATEEDVAVETPVEVETVALRIDIGPEPQRVRLTLDGEPVPNPTFLEVPVGRHTLRATRDGFEDFEWTSDFRFAQSVERTLRAEEEEAPTAERPERDTPAVMTRAGMRSQMTATTTTMAEDETPPRTAMETVVAEPAMATETTMTTMTAPSMESATTSAMDGVSNPLLGM